MKKLLGGMVLVLSLAVLAGCGQDKKGATPASAPTLPPGVQSGKEPIKPPATMPDVKPVAPPKPGDPPPPLPTKN